MVIVVDDGSRDRTAAVARSLGKVIVHSHRTISDTARTRKRAIAWRYSTGGHHRDGPSGLPVTPKLIPAMADLVATGLYECVLGSRILGGRALKGGMPIWRTSRTAGLTLVGNLLLGSKVSEFHTGYPRVHAHAARAAAPRRELGMISSSKRDPRRDHLAGAAIGEVSCPTRYRRRVVDHVQSERALRGSDASRRHACSGCVNCAWPARSGFLPNNTAELAL